MSNDFLHPLVTLQDNNDVHNGKRDTSQSSSGPFLDMARYLNSCGMGQVGGYGTRSDVMSRPLVHVIGQGSAECLLSSAISWCCWSPQRRLRVLLDDRQTSIWLWIGFVRLWYQSVNLSVNGLHDLVNVSPRHSSAHLDYPGASFCRKYSSGAPVRLTMASKELLTLLGQLGLRVNDIHPELMVITKEKSEVASTIDSMERSVYPQLRTLVRQRVKSRDLLH